MSIAEHRCVSNTCEGPAVAEKIQVHGIVTQQWLSTSEEDSWSNVVKRWYSSTRFQLSAFQFVDQDEY